MKRRSKASLIVFAVIALICCGAWFSLTSGSDSLGAGIAAYHKAGLPWTADELQPPIPAAEDGGPLLIQGFEGLDRLKAYNEEQLIADAVDHGDFGYAANHLAPFAKELELVADAVKKPHVVFPKDWDLGAFVMFPEYSTGRTAGKLLCDRAQLEARRGEVAASCADIQVASLLADRIGEEPVMIGTLSQLGQRTTIFRTVEACAAVYSGKAESEKALAAVFAKMSGTPDLVNSARGEAYMNLATIRNWSMMQSRVRNYSDSAFSGLPPINPNRLVRNGDPGGLQIDLLGGPVLLNESQYAEIAMKDQGNPKQLMDDVKALDTSLASHHGLRNFLSDMLSPVFSNIGESVLRDTAQKETMQALLEAEIIKAERGQFPQEISALPTKWIDPCDGKPLRLIAVKGGIRIYSVGPDMKDDGGKTQYEAKNSNEFDVVAGDPPPPRKYVVTQKKPGPP